MNILMIVTGDWRYDPRVLQERSALTSNGHAVSVVDWKDKPSNKLRWFFYLFLWYYKEYRLNKNICFDVVHCHDFDTLLLGVLLKKQLGCKLVYDSHEMYAFMTDIWLVLPLEKLLMSNVDHLIAVDEGTQAYLEYLDGKDPLILENCKPDVVPFYKPTGNERFTVLYLGTLTRLRMFPDVLDAFKDLDADFIVGGYGVEYDAVQKKASEYDNVYFVGRQPSVEMLSYTLNADAVLCMMNPGNKNCLLGLPNKFYECMVCGRPMIVTKDTMIGETVEWNDLGVITDYSVSGVRKAVQQLIRNPELTKTYGRNMFNMGKNRNWNTEKQKLVSLYENM